MVRYDSRRGSKYGRGGYGSRRDSRYAGRGSRYDRYGKRSREEDEYEEEPPYYETAPKGKMSHEQISLIVLVAVGVLVLVVIIFSFAGQSASVPNPALEAELGVKGKKAAERRQDSREMEASRLLEDARSFDRQNPYEDKEVVAEEYRKVYDKFPDTEASKEARQKYNEVMDRRK